MTYEQAIQDIDKLNDDLKNTLLALASYDWHFFNDARIFDLKRSYNVKADNKYIFRYYHTATDDKEMIEIHNMRYVDKYKQYLGHLLANV